MSKIAKPIIASGLVAALSVAALPLTTYAANTADVEVNLNVSQVINLELNNVSVETSLNPNTADTTSMSSIATVNTNSTSGYSVTTKSTTASADLSNGSSTIPASDGEPTAGTASWAITSGGVTGDGTSPLTSTWKAVPGSGAETALTVLTSDSATASTGDTITVKYGVATGSTTPSGTYTNTIRYTATVK